MNLTVKLLIVPVILFMIPPELLAQAGSITLLSPNGGERLRIGSSQSISWNSDSAGTMVRVEISRDGGASYSTLIAQTSNDGSESWTVTGPPTNRARIRIRSVSDSTILDASNANFLIGNNVTFQVNMSVAIEEEVFEVGDAIDVVGDFNGFTPGIDPLSDNDGDRIYTGTTTILTAVGTQINYKFWKSPRDGISLETRPNRVFTLQSSNDIRPVVYFNDDSVAGSIPAPPVLVSPPTGSGNQPTSLTFQWNASSGATSYGLQISASPSFAPLRVNAQNLTTTSFRVDTLSPGQSYWWRVNATNASGSSSYSSVWNFTTAFSPPATPTLASPSNGSTNQATTLTLNWNHAANATSYRLQVSTSSTFATTVLDDSGITSLSRSVGPLQSGVTYYWRVSSKNSAGSSSFSPAWQFITSQAAPAAPVLASPANNAANQPATLSLSWTASSGASSYRLQVSTSNTFSSLTLNDSTITATSRVVTLAANTTYYWRVNAKNSGGTSPYSTTWSFTTAPNLPPPPATPALVSPANGSSNQPLQVTLDWNTSSGATAYHLQLSTSATFTTFLVNDSNITGSSLPVGPLGYNTSYYWRVSARNSGGRSAWSASWSFTTMVSAPSAPVPVSPPDNSVNQPLTPTLSWNAAAGALAYRVQLSLSSDFSTTLVDDSTVLATSEQVGPLAATTTYYWRVRARNISGWGTYSTTQRFTTIGDPPPRPQLQSPDNNATDLPIQVTLRWNAGGDPTSYRLQVSRSSSFSSPIVDSDNLTSNSFVLASLSYSTKYYWRVRSRKNENVSEYSETWSFTTAGPVPSPPALVSPENGQTNLPTTVILDWNASGGATTYHVQVATDQAFTALFLDDGTLTQTSRSITNLSHNVTYYWHVSAKNGNGESAYSGTRSFTIDPGVPPPPPAPSLSAPPNGALDQPIALTLGWNNSSGASFYRVQLSSNSSFSTVLVDDANITGNTREVSALTTNTKYYWRVSARNAGGSSGYSSTWSFTTGSNLPMPPPPPKLSSPGNNSTNVPTTVTLNWDPASRAVSYRLQVSTTQSFSSTIVDQSGITSTSQQVGPLATGTLYYWRVQATNTGGSSDFSNTWKFTTVSGPAISIAPVYGTPTAGEPLNIRITLPSNVQATTSGLYYKAGGEQAFRTTGFTRTGDDLDATIPGDMVGLRGLQYYVQVSDGQREYYYPPSSPVNNPAVILVDQITATTPLPLTRQTFRMISIPATVHDSTLANILQDDYGEYNARRWRLFHWDDTGYVETSDLSTHYSTGKAYWIVTNDGKQFDIDGALSTNPSRSYVLRLRPGWNQIGNPFAFPVSWSDIVAYSGGDGYRVQQPVFWDGERGEYIYNIATIWPWEGYYVYNRTSSTVTLIVPPIASAGSPSKRRTQSPSSVQYELQMSASLPGGITADNENYVGIAGGSDVQELNFLEAPAIVDGVRLSIMDAGTAYAGSYKTGSAGGEWWNLQLYAPEGADYVDLRLLEQQARPDGFDIYLLDQESWTIIPQIDGIYRLPFDDRTRIHNLKLVIGTPQYALEQSGGIPLVPKTFSLRQNYPNPFNPLTRIDYELGRRSLVRLDIFSAGGQLVRKLVDDELLTGEHTATWDGTNEEGSPVASGVYFYRLRAGDFNTTRKLMLLR